MRSIQSLGSSWRYFDRYEESFAAPDYPLSAWRAVDLPHANRELPYNAFDEKSYQFVSSYARDFEAPDLSGGKRAFLDFDGVMASCEVWLNGRRAGSHRGGYTPFSLEITGLVRPGQNRLFVKVDSTEQKDLPPFGGVIDYLTYGGIYRGAFLRTQEGAYLKDLCARPGPALEEVKMLEALAEVDGLPEGLSLRARLRDGARSLGETRCAISSDGKSALRLEGLAGLRPWDVDDPALYELEVELLRGEEAIDSLVRRVGFRSAEWRSEGFFLNGRLLKIRGLNRHQSWPYVGYAMPARAQRRDAEILKRELGVNLVRTSHYPQSPAFLDACDELGLLVFEELPGWQHIGDEAWKDQACRDLEAMIMRDRSRASVVLWGVRINESQDDHDFYARTNEIARRLDPTRARGGVRYIEKSELLEDVYTFNDFNYNGNTVPLREQRKVTGLKRLVPYLITEHNGHMFPTKRFDNEERLAGQALRHARVLDASWGAKGTAGAIGWCAFDYNTHKDFGSGDRVCYHGVSDMFRIPKYAAALYASQKDVADGIVLEAASIFAKGERDAARMLPIEIYTNCDEVVLYRGGKRIGSFSPDRRGFPNLPHPPVVIRDLVGDQLDGSKFSKWDLKTLKRVVSRIFISGMESLTKADNLSIGLLLMRNHMSFGEGVELVSRFVLGWGAEDESWEIAGLVGGKEIARRSYGSDAIPARLALEPDDESIGAVGADLYGEAWDCTRVVVRLLDQYGNLAPFATECVDVSIEGPGSVIGPSRLVLQGGCLAFWVRATGPGRIKVSASGTRLKAETIEIAAV
jgi:beta-galactosidase